MLAQSFNRMVERLQTSFQALEAANQTLETRVQDRTAALQVANQEIQQLNERLQEDNLRMSTELEITRRLQQMILPKEEELQQVQSLDIAGFMEPASEMGGDYYDVLQGNGRIKIGIGDVTSSSMPEMWWCFTPMAFLKQKTSKDACMG